MNSRTWIGSVLAGIAVWGCGMEGGQPGDAALPGCVDGPLSYQNADVRLARTVGGVDESPGSPAFGSVQGLAVSETGDLVVLDMFAGVYLVDPEGAVIDTYGRSGSGPGEFERPWILGLAADGGIHVMDAALWRVTSFPLDGSVSTQQLPPDPRMGQLPLAEFDADGHLYNLSFRLFETTLLAHAERGLGRVVRGANMLQRWDPEAATWVDLIEVPSQEVYLTPAGGLADPPFATTPVWTTASEGRFWYGDGAAPTMTRYSEGGEAECVVSLDIDPVPVLDAERRRFYDVRGNPNLPDERRERIRQSREDLPMPEHKPLMLGARTSSEGDLWINVSTADGVEGDIWYGVDVSERTVRRVTLPAGFVPMTIDSGTMYGPQMSPVGVPQVAVYELDTSSEDGR